MIVQLRTVGLDVTGPARGATRPVAPQTTQPAYELPLPAEATVDDLLRRAAEIGVPTQQVNEVLLNGKVVGLDAILHDGDAVTLIGQETGV